MMIPNDPFLGTWLIGKEEKKAVISVLDNKSLFRYHGPNLLYKTEEFEKNMANYLGVKHVLAVSNGGAAIKLACIANGIGPGDEVLMSPLTFIASANSVLTCGAVPKFVNINQSINIDPDEIEQNITPQTKAILAIHLKGQPCNMEKIMVIANKHNLVVIEDCAQAFGSKIGDKNVGTFGSVGAFSLQAGKTITCGEGGFIATNDTKLYSRAKMYHDNGGLRKGCEYPIWNNKKTFFGENFKITEIQSAIANEQLKKINKILEHQKKSYDYIINKVDLKYYNNRANIKNNINVNSNICFVFGTKRKCKQFIKFMNDNGIGFNYYSNKLINDFDTFKYRNSYHYSSYPYNLSKYTETNLEKSKEIMLRTAIFDLSYSLKNKHLKYLVEKLREFSNEF